MNFENTIAYCLGEESNIDKTKFFNKESIEYNIKRTENSIATLLAKSNDSDNYFLELSKNNNKDFNAVQFEFIQQAIHGQIKNKDGELITLTNVKDDNKKIPTNGSYEKDEEEGCAIKFKDAYFYSAGKGSNDYTTFSYRNNSLKKADGEDIVLPESWLTRIDDINNWELKNLSKLYCIKFVFNGKKVFSNKISYSNLFDDKNNDISYIIFYFKASDKIYYYKFNVEKFLNDNNKTYFYPTILSWESEEIKGYYHEYKLNNDKYEIIGNKLNSIVTFVISNNIKTSELLDHNVIGFATNSKLLSVNCEDKWAKQIAQEQIGVPLLQSAPAHTYYNITCKTEEGKTYTKQTTIFGSASNSIQDIFKGHYKLDNLLEKDTEVGINKVLYSITATKEEVDKKVTLANDSSYGDYIKFGSEQLYLKEKDENNSSSKKYKTLTELKLSLLIDKLGGFRQNFYTDKNGVIKIGYGFTSEDKDFGVGEEFENLKLYATKNSVDNFDNKNKPWLAAPNSSNISDITINKEKASRIFSRKISKREQKVLESILENQPDRNQYYTDGTITSQILSKLHKGTNGSNKILSELTQTQWDDLVIESFIGNESLFSAIKNYSGSDFKEFCKIVSEYINEEFKDDFKTKDETKKDDKIKGEQPVTELTIELISTAKYRVASVLKKDEFNKDSTFEQNGYSQGSYRNVYFLDLLEEVVDLGKEAAEEKKIEAIEEKIDWQKEKDFINKWSINAVDKNEVKEQEFRDVQHYYDFYSGMTPYVEVWFRDRKKGENGTYKWNIINSINHPYIKNLTVDDKGVKKIELKLFDKDFASYQYGTLRAFDSVTNEEIKELYSLDMLIKTSLMTPQEKEKEEKVQKYKTEETEEDLKNGYLKIDEYQTGISPANLIVRYGYCDANQPLDEKLKKYYKENYNVEPSERTNRWFNVLEDDAREVTTLKWDHKINNGSLEAGTTVLDNQSAQIITYEKKSKTSDDVKQKSFNMTTVLSYAVEYMILGYKTTLKSTGIEYDISAVEVKNVEAMKKRFLQRYSEITSYPLEVLYILMRIFNENDDGKIMKTGVKLLYWNDSNKVKQAADSFNMNYDFSGAKESELKNLKYLKDTYYSEVNEKPFFEQYLKKISLSFGSEAALRNYNDDDMPLYKSLDSLLNEFCAACPPRTEYVKDEKETKTTDKDGNEIKTNTHNSTGNLTWMVTNSDQDKDNIYIIFYYKKIRKPHIIRRYVWGPTNPNKSVVTRVDIHNNNEFAMLSGVTTTFFDGNRMSEDFMQNNKNTGETTEEGSSTYERDFDTSNLLKNYNDGNSIVTTYAASNSTQANRIKNALANSMYTGTIEVLGDPSLEFNMVRQPYTYPIYLEILVPLNDLTTDARWAEKLRDFDSKEFGTLDYIKGNQRIHEMTGYYVITSINHSISSSGYKTTLGVSRYPNIEKDILKFEDGKPIAPIEPKHVK